MEQITPKRHERMMVGESTGEIVLHRKQLDKLKNVITPEPICGFRAAFSDIFEKFRKRN